MPTLFSRDHRECPTNFRDKKRLAENKKAAVRTAAYRVNALIEDEFVPVSN
jgi:hypothetical protein